MDFEHGQNTKSGWSDPTSLPRKPWRSLQPGEQEKPLLAMCFTRVELVQKRKKKGRRTHVDHQQTAGDSETRIRIAGANSGGRREVRGVHRQHARSCRELGTQDGPLERCRLPSLAQATAGAQ